MTGGDQRGWRAACPFCPIIRGRAPVSRVYEDASALAFMDVNPVQRGHRCLPTLVRALVAAIGADATARPSFTSTST